MSRKTVIITGGTKGLGRAMSVEFARHGHLVIGLYASDDAAAELCRAELLSISPGSFVEKHDVTSDDTRLWSRPEILDATQLVLLNNAAAPFTPRPFHLLQWDEVESGLRVGLKGSWQCSRAVLRPMIKQGGGTIVNVLTTALHGLPPKGFAAYAAAKHALRGLTLSLAAEYADKGVRVMSVSPGFMPTSMTSGWDARILDAIRASGTGSDPATAARRVRQLVESTETPARGEDYPV